MSKRKKRNWLSFILFIMLGTAAAIFFLAPKLSEIASSINDTTPEPTSPQPEESLTATITIARVDSLTSLIEHLYPANVIATEHSQISSQVAGQIKSLSVELGDRITTNGIIAELDCDQLSYEKDILIARKSAAEEQLNRQEKQQHRLNNLQSKGAATIAQLDDINTAISQASANISVIEANINKLNNTLDKCQIRAPFPGIITAVSASEGQYATPGAPIVTLLNPLSQKIESALRPDVINGLTKATTPQFIFNQEYFPATVTTINKAISSAANTQIVRLSTQDNTKLIVDSHGKIEWQAGKALPPQYAVIRNGQIGIYLYHDETDRPPNHDIFEFIPIKGAQEGRAIKLSDEIAPNSLIVTVGHHHVNQNYPINVINESGNQ